MTSSRSTNKNPRPALQALALAVAMACASCATPIDMVHRVSVDVQAHPKDLRACVGEAIRGVDGVPGLNPPSAGT